jgi:tRNA (adenine22-N1)-methyltransferase
LITPRLHAILSKISTPTLADIGTDHAYIPIRLVQMGKIESAIATDINPGPIKIAKRNIEKYGLSDRICVRLGGGLTPLHKGEVETILIAGMGGELISSIIRKDLDKAHSARRLILQPMNAQYELRKMLEKNGFRIIEEDLALEGFKVYNLMTVETGHSQAHEEIFYHLPKSLQSHPYFPHLKAKKRREFTKILKGLTRAKMKDTEQIEKYRTLLDELEQLQEE